MVYTLPFAALSLALATQGAPTLEERFERRAYQSGGKAVVVEVATDHLALRANPGTDPALLALAAEDAAAKVAPPGAWPKVSGAVLARPHGLFLVRFAEALPRELLVSLAAALEGHPAVARVYPGLARATGRAFSDERLVVTASPGRLDEVLQKALAQTGGELLRVSSVPHTALLAVGPRYAYDAVEASRALVGIAGLVSAEPELYREYALKQALLDDPRLAEQWHLSRGEGDAVPGVGQVFAPGAWAVTQGDPAVVVAVFDSGTEIGHGDLASNVVGGFDAVDGDDDPSPECSWSQDGRTYAPTCPDDRPFRESHGTAVSGVIAARGGNGVGVAGVCPQCSLMPVRLLGSSMVGSSLSTAEAFVRAVDEGAWIINNSWGPGTSIYFPLSQAVKDAFEHARTTGRGGKGTVILFAAGNDTSDVAKDAYAAWHTTVAVSASTNLDDFALYSNWGLEIDVAAPSRGGSVTADAFGIVTTDVSGGEGYDEGDYTSGFGGTSAASPVVAGVAGLVLSANPSLTAEQVRLVLTSSADKIRADKLDWMQLIGQDLEVLFDYDERGHSRGFGFGRVNATAAVLAAASASLLGASCDAADCNVCDTDLDRCLSRCEEQADCPDGTTCRGGLCRLPRPHPLAIGQPCRADCPSCVPAADTEFEVHLLCTDVCEADTVCPAGFACRRPEAGGPKVCMPGAANAGEPEGYFNCRTSLGVAIVVATETERFCSDACFAEGGCPFGFSCAPARCACERQTQWGCMLYRCEEAANPNLVNFPAPLCFPNEGFGLGCAEDLDCPTGDYCKAGACVLDDRAGCSICESCDWHDECGPLGYCAGLRSGAGYCTKVCAKAEDCPGDSVCKQISLGNNRGEIGFCSAPGALDEEICAGAEAWGCAVACRDDVPCDAGLVCDGGACVTAPPPPPSKEDDEDVPPVGASCGCGAASAADVGGLLGLLLLGALARARRWG
jgi:subtilisin family serine protease